MNKNYDVSVLGKPDILSVVFHPRREVELVTDEGFTRLKIPVADDVDLGGRLYGADKEKPTILFFHGNGEIVADYGNIAALYTAVGINFLLVDYRGYGRSTGRPTVTSMLADARLVFAFVRDWLGARNQTGALVVMGRSLGSAPALEIAASFRDEVDGLIIESGFADTSSLINRLGARIPNTLGDNDIMGQTRKIGQYDGPLLIMHGSSDEIIPVADAHALMRASVSNSKRILVIEGAGHNDLLFRGLKEYMGAVVELVKKTEGG